MLVLYIIPGGLLLSLLFNLGIYGVQPTGKNLFRIELPATSLILYDAAEKVVVPDPGAAPHRADLSAALGIEGGVGFLIASRLETRPQNRKGVFPVAVLAPAVGVCLRASGKMSDANGGVPGVAVLSTGTLSADCFKAQVGVGNREILIARTPEHRNGDGRRLAPTVLLRRRYALDAVDARLESERFEDPGTVNLQNDARLRRIQSIWHESEFNGVGHVHLCHVHDEEFGVVSALAGSDLDDH